MNLPAICDQLPARQSAPASLVGVAGAASETLAASSPTPCLLAFWSSLGLPARGVGQSCGEEPCLPQPLVLTGQWVAEVNARNEGWHL